MSLVWDTKENNLMKKIILAVALSMLAFGATAEHGDEAIKYRVDQDAVTYVEANMMYSNNCEYQLNSRVTRYNVDTDGIVEADDDWMEILNFFCDGRTGFSSMF